MQNIKVFTFLTILLFNTACNGPDKKGAPKEKEHPKLNKTIGDPKYGNVQCSLQDKEGSLWFGTTENGLYKYDEESQPVGQAGFTQYLVADGLNSNNISCLLEDKIGKIWIGTKARLCLYDSSAYLDSDQHKSLRIGGKKFAEIKIPLPKNMPPNTNPYNRNLHSVYSMMQAKSGEIWFVTIDGVYIYDGKVFTLFIIDEAANGFLTINDKVERILEDNAGNIWFGGRTNEGVNRYDGKSVTNFKLKELFQDGPKPKAHNWAWPQVQDKNGHIWFSNWGGAYRYDPSAYLKIKLEIFGWVREKQASTFTMEKHLLRIQNINTRL